MPRDPAERVRELWAELAAWFADNGATHNERSLARGASARALAALERATGRTLPADYRASLALHDGGGDFESYTYLGTEEVARWWQIWHDAQARGELAEPVDGGGLDRWWDDAWLPFAADSCGNLLCIDTGRARRLLALESQDGQGVFVMPGRKTFIDWLATYRDKLVAGELVVDEEGFVGEPIIKPMVAGGEELPELAPALSARVEAMIGRGDASGLARLLDAGELSPGSALTYQRSLLGVAAEAGKLAVVELLLARGAGVDVGKPQGERTPLFWAVWGMQPKLDVVACLLQHGADPNALTGYDGTPLHAAVMWEQQGAIRLLLAAGADLQAKNANGQTPAETAKGAIRTLLGGGAEKPAAKKKTTKKVAKKSTKKASARRTG